MSIGRLFPFGKSVPLPGDSPVFSLIRLRDETMTAGGTDDVRGWGSRLLGPKFPAVEAHIRRKRYRSLRRQLRAGGNAGATRRNPGTPVSLSGPDRVPGELSCLWTWARCGLRMTGFKLRGIGGRHRPSFLAGHRDQLPDSGRRHSPGAGLQAESVRPGCPRRRRGTGCVGAGLTGNHGGNGLVSTAASSPLLRHDPVSQRLFVSFLRIRTTASIVFQFRVVAGTLNSLSIWPR